LVKLIVTDMDGTLLNDKKELPEKTFAIINQLQKRGITFAVASGREYQSLLQIYKEIADDIIIVADNGARIANKGKITFYDTFAPANIKEIVMAVNQIPSLKIVICGLKSTYMFEDDLMPGMAEHLVSSYFPQRVLIKNLSELPADDEVIKFAIFDPNQQAQKNIYEKVKHLHHKYQLAVSGAEWMDIMNLGVNKGVAVKKIQQSLGIGAKETMVFGDAQNDYEMMQQAYYSYAMANAVAEIKAVANFTAPSNEANGVIQILENFLTKHDADV